MPVWRSKVLWSKCSVHSLMMTCFQLVTTTHLGQNSSFGLVFFTCFDHFRSLLGRPVVAQNFPILQGYYPGWQPGNSDADNNHAPCATQMLCIFFVRGLDREDGSCPNTLCFPYTQEQAGLDRCIRNLSPVPSWVNLDLRRLAPDMATVWQLLWGSQSWKDETTGSITRVLHGMESCVRCPLWAVIPSERWRGVKHPFHTMASDWSMVLESFEGRKKAWMNEWMNEWRMDGWMSEWASE